MVAALQNVTNEADRKFLADELLGGSSEKLSGLLNLTNEELAAQLQHLADTGDFMSRDALDAAEEYSGGMDRLKSSLSSVSTFIGTELIKTLNEWIGKVQETIDGIKQLGRWLGIVQDDTNEFTEAADEMAETLGDGTAPAIVITTEAAEEAAPAVAKMGDEAETASDKVEVLTSTSRTGAEVIEALRVKSLDAKSAIELMRLEVEASDGSMISANTTALTYTDTMTSMERVLEAWRITQLEARQEADLFSLSLGTVRTGYTNVAAAAETAAAATDKATSAQERFNAALARDLANSQNGRAALTNTHPGGGRTSGRSAGPATSHTFRELHGRDNILRAGPDGEPTAASIAAYQAHIAEFGPREGDRTFPNTPAAQHGAAVRGSRYGSLVRVGENFTNENIVPVGRSGGGGLGSGNRPIRINLSLGRKEFEDVWVGTADDLVRQGRVQEDILN